MSDLKIIRERCCTYGAYHVYLVYDETDPESRERYYEVMWLDNAGNTRRSIGMRELEYAADFAKRKSERREVWREAKETVDRMDRGGDE